MNFAFAFIDTSYGTQYIQPKTELKMYFILNMLDRLMICLKYGYLMHNAEHIKSVT